MIKVEGNLNNKVSAWTLGKSFLTISHQKLKIAERGEFSFLFLLMFRGQ